MRFHQSNSRVFTAFIMMFALISIAISGLAHAQENVNLRYGAHDDYSRVVFDWPAATDYEATKSGGTLSLSFNRPATIDVTAVNKAALKNIGTLSVTSAAGQDLSVDVQIKSASRHRAFKIGNRVVVDVYNAAGEIDRTAPNAKVSEPKAPPAAIVKSPTQKALEEPVIEEQKPFVLEGIEPHVMTVTSTKSVGLAVFEREGFLWVILDDPSIRTEPVISGPKKSSFPKIEKFPLQGAVGYRMQRPEGYHFYGEGGGLVWRIVMTPKPRKTSPIMPIVQKDAPDDLAGGTLIWPFNSIRKIITFDDPLIGDSVTVITTEGSDNFTKVARSYIELDVLPSTIGMAFLPKADDITTTATPKGVAITRPQGLSLSNPRDTALAILEDDIEKEKNVFEEEEKDGDATKIFNFDRWEMGGVTALDNNRQILMRGISAKQGSAKVENIITLAKLNVANNRGPEALGLLRVASQELPGIDENVEFLALRGAAEVLSDKNDLAINDLSTPRLDPYAEVNYWRTKALAGVEDWQQADAVMPNDFDILESYPLAIRKPLVLSMTEVALRSAKTDIAKELLDMLEPDYMDMSLSHQSAWKYLMGELERQKGDDDLAIDNWEELVQGKDDYYRAKAALSLTRLQLMRKKITPAKAIDRLENLRYAWRGDELELLINYRLGEVYIENDDYLKGLSVLRNAISLAPDTAMGKEVTNYMTQTFRKLFTDGSLDDISPLDAVSIYEEFKELTPIGEQGDVFVQNLAERLVDVDLLGRASSLLEEQLKFRLKGEEAVKVGIRLAAIRLLDDKPDLALRNLAMAQQKLEGVANKREYSRDINLLKARALSKTNRVNDALDVLNKLPKDMVVNRLRADIAWNAGQWDKAANAFSDLIQNEKISMTRPPDEYETDLILNRGIALNLSGDRTAMAAFRDKYKDLMAQSEKAKIFNLVTRPRQLGMLDSEDSISSLISEVDLFGEFLENYKAGE